VNYKEIKTTYFLENDKWNIDFFKDISQFKDEITNYKYTSKNISFSFNNNINKEIKFILYNKLFSDEWKLTSVLTGQIHYVRCLAAFINEKYPSINSLFKLDLKN